MSERTSAPTVEHSLNALRVELYRDSIFGCAVAHLDVVEFQKRGLPHAHILVILAQHARPMTPEQVDSCVVAELPVAPLRDHYERLADYENATRRYEDLRELVVTHMIHHECGHANPNASCMKDGKCSSSFPKPFTSETHFTETNIYPQYRRRSPSDLPGSSHAMRSGRIVDNRWVVPFSPYLLLKYQCHLNVEVVGSVASVRYLYKYVHKGPDRAMAAVARTELDECTSFQDMRSFGACESSWRTFAFSMYSRSPGIVRLAVHLEGNQRIQWDQDEADGARHAIEGGIPRSTLTEWLTMLRHGTADVGTPILPDVHAPPGTAAAHGWSATYADFPEKFRWTATTRRWTRRTRSTDTIGRVYHVNANSGDLYYLRMLLHRIPGNALALSSAPADESVEDAAIRVDDAFTLRALLYVNGVKHSTYKEACRALGLMQDDGEWYDALRAINDHVATQERTALELRNTYCAILEFSHPQDAQGLLDAFRYEMAGDYVLFLRNAGVAERDIPRLAVGRLLFELEERMHARCLCSLEAFGVAFSPDARRAARHVRTLEEEHNNGSADTAMPRILRDELPTAAMRQHNHTLYEREWQQAYQAQRDALDAVRDALLHNRDLCLFLDAPGGTGKTFTANAMLHCVRGQGHVALAVASTGIAALLLEGGRTFHSRFKPSRIPAADKNLNIVAESPEAQLIREARLILWDEAAMGHKFHLDALNRTLQDLMSFVDPELRDRPFGGKIIVLCGGM